MDIKNKIICEVCEKNPAMGRSFGNKWSCGACIIKFDNEIKLQKKQYFDQIIKKIREEN